MIHRSFLNGFSSPDLLFPLRGKHKRGPHGTPLSLFLPKLAGIRCQSLRAWIKYARLCATKGQIANAHWVKPPFSPPFQEEPPIC